MKKLCALFLLVSQIMYTSDSTLKDLRIAQRDIDKKILKYNTSITSLHKEVCDLDLHIAALESSDLFKRSGNQEWMNWQRLHAKLRAYQTLCPQEKSQCMPVVQTPWYAITPETYWGMLTNTSSQLFYKKYGCRVEFLEFQREQFVDKIAYQISMKLDKERALSVLVRHRNKHEGLLQKCTHRIEEKAIGHIVLLQSLVRKNIACHEVATMRDIQSTRAKAMIVHQELRDFIKNKEAQAIIVAEQQAQLEEEERQETARLAQHKQEAQKLHIKNEKKEAQRAGQQASMAIKKEKEAQEAAKKEVARKLQSDRDKAKRQQKLAAEQAAKAQSDADLALLDALVSQHAVKQEALPITLVQDQPCVQIRPEIQKIITTRRKAFANCGPMDESLRYQVDKYDRSNNLFFDMHDGPAHIIYLLHDLFESKSDNNRMLLQDACEKMKALDALLRSHPEEIQLPIYFRGEKRLIGLIESRLAVVAAICKDYDDIDALTDETKQLIENGKTIDKITPFALIFNRLAGRTVETTKSDVIQDAKNMLYKKGNDMVVRMSNLVLECRLKALLELMVSGPENVQEQPLDSVMSHNPHEKA